MLGLEEMLQELEAPGAQELALGTGKPPAVLLASGGVKPLDFQPMLPADVTDLIRGTPLAEALKAAGSDPSEVRARLFGRDYRVLVSRSGLEVTLRIAQRGMSRVGARATLDNGERDEIKAMVKATAELLEDKDQARRGRLGTPRRRLSMPRARLDEAPAPEPAPDEPAPPRERYSRATGKRLLRQPPPDAQVEPPEPSPSAPAAAAEPADAGEPTAHPHLVELLEAARGRGATDVHLRAERPPMLRRHGVLSELQARAPTAEELEGLVESLWAGGRRAVLEERGFLRLSTSAGPAGRVRVVLGRDRAGLRASFRLLGEAVPSLAELGVPERLGSVAGMSDGLVLISGPRGHGRSSTAAALVDLISQQHCCSVVTLEAPVELLHRRARAVVSQREVGGDWHAAVRNALREAPDVMLFSDLREPEAISAALTALAAGPLVIATLAATSTTRAVEAVVGAARPEDRPAVLELLSEEVQLVSCQHLLPTTSGDRAAVCELMVRCDALRETLREGRLAQLATLLQRQQAGMMRYEDSLAALISAGRIAGETARAFLQALSPPAATGGQPAVRPELAHTDAADKGRGGLVDRVGGLFRKKEP